MGWLIDRWVGWVGWVGGWVGWVTFFDGTGGGGGGLWEGQALEEVVVGWGKESLGLWRRRVDGWVGRELCVCWKGRGQRGGWNALL